MILLIDTNIILDYLTPRQPYMKAATDIFNLCVDKKCIGYIAAHSVTNIFYILRKQYSAIKRKSILLDLCEFIDIAGVQKYEVINALLDGAITDFEDGVQVECAKAIGAKYIVTRNTNDFLTSPVPAILPEDLIQNIIRI